MDFMSEQLNMARAGSEAAAREIVASFNPTDGAPDPDDLPLPFEGIIPILPLPTAVATEQRRKRGRPRGPQRQSSAKKSGAPRKKQVQLNAETRRQIRKDYGEKRFTAEGLAERHGVVPQTIYKILAEDHDPRPRGRPTSREADTNCLSRDVEDS